MTICTKAEYRRRTGDSSSYDGLVDTALAKAQKLVEDKTDRFFESATRTETLTVKENGRVYPHALPLTSVSVPAGASVDGSSVIGTGGSWVDPDYSLNIPDWTFPATRRLTSTVTYIGGYTADTMPDDVVGLVAEIAELALHPASMAGVPAGATAVTSGSHTVSGPFLGGSSSLPPAIARQLRLWARREV